MLDKIRPYAKAVAAFLAPGATALVAALQETSPGGSGVTSSEVVGIVAAMVVTAGAVYTIPNTAAATKGKHEAGQ